MSFKAEIREQIKQYILEKISEGCDGIARHTADAFAISQNSAYRYIRELLQANIIVKNGSKYELVETMQSVYLQRSNHDLKEEDSIYYKHIQPIVRDYPENVRRIWEYAFMEMMNNAIDHSEAEHVFIFVLKNYMSTTIILLDDGIGIFHKIRDYYGFGSLDDAVNELFKGKLTTDKTKHSGEGIFFTSRVLDSFAAMSEGKIFTHDKFEGFLHDLEEIPELYKYKNKKGTIILMSLSNFSNKQLKEVFDMFSDDDGAFTKTQIPLKNIFDTYPVSRSQAKRLCQRFDKFEEVILDFEGIDEIGQGFAHELFVVFQNEHPELKLTVVNENEDVKRMLRHVGVDAANIQKADKSE